MFYLKVVGNPTRVELRVSRGMGRERCIKGLWVSGVRGFELAVF